MVSIVRVALKYPYTAIVMAIFILIFGASSLLRAQADIVPDINIPVIAVVWTYRGLSPHDTRTEGLPISIGNMIVMFRKQP